MKFTVIGNTAGDSATHYMVSDYEARNVGDLINEILECHPNELGNIYVDDGLHLNSACCEYKHGHLLGEFQKFVLKKEIDVVKATVGWSNMDYEIIVKKKRKV